jgi:hypothetical protein
VYREPVLPAFAILELSETATLPGECNTSSTLDGTTYSSANGQQIVHPSLKKTGVQIT